MNREERQSAHEKQWSQAFIDYLNSTHVYDYVLAEHNNSKTPEWTDVDVAAVSKTGLPELYLQLTSDRRFDRTIYADGHASQVFTSDNVLTAIDDKFKKYKKSGKDFSHITLVVQGNMNRKTADMDFDDSFLQQCRQYPFKSIYYISPPKVWGPKGVSNYEGWFVVPLKI